jgi:hypothetical protein
MAMMRSLGNVASREPRTSLVNLGLFLDESGSQGKLAGARQPGHFVADRQLKGAFHPFAAWPGLLHSALHLGLRLAGLLRLVSNLVILCLMLILIAGVLISVG